MTNLEWLKKTMNNEEKNADMFCRVLFEKTESKSCYGKSCENCKYNYFGNVVDYLLQEHKEKIKITQFEYDLLLNCMEAIKENEKDNDVIGEWWIIKGMKEKGHFKNIEMGITFKEVLANCEIVPYDYEF